MHFISEACYRRPLEPRGLAYSRGGTAIMMGLLFLAFVGYLINQIYNDHPLIQISTEQIELDIETPDVEMCAQGSTLSVVKCSAMYYNWTVVDIPNCFQDYFRAGANNETSKCYVFETRNRYRMSTDSKRNLTQASISIPAIAVQLYDPHFTTWTPETVGKSPMEVETATNIELGVSRATSYLNYTSAIFYHLQKYRAIKPGSVASVLGFASEYIEITTLLNNQHDWPIQQPSPPPPAFPKSLYDGYFSVQLSQSTIDIKTEIRQHTVLASVALAGGSYGLLTTIYILLFGMTRLTPWGLVHHIPVFISKRKNHHITDEEKQQLNTNVSKSSITPTILIPWFFRSRFRGANKTYTPNDPREAVMANMIQKSRLLDQQEDLSKIDSHPSETRDGENVYYQPPPLPTGAPPLPPHGSSSHTTTPDRTTELANRVEELEIILSEYFINTAYLDQLRNRRSGPDEMIPLRQTTENNR